MQKTTIIKALQKKIAEVEECVASQAKLIEAQAEKIAELERRLNKNSRNSSIPVGSQDAKLGSEFTRDLNFFNRKNPKEYWRYFEVFSG